MSNPYSIARIFSQMELELIASMKRNLARHEAEEEELGFQWEQWQQRKLEALSRYRKENARLLAAHGSEVDRLTGDMLKTDYLQGAGRVDGLIRQYWNRIRHLFISGELTEPITRVDGTDESFFRMNEHRLNTLIEAATGELREGRHAMLRMADDVYRQTIYKSQVYMNSGAATLHKAIDMATKDFLDKGFNCITFKDGRKVNIASYAEMVLRTSSQRAVFAGEGARREEWGVKTVIVSAHNNCSALCLPWQGKPYVDDVYSGGQTGDKGGMTLLSTAMRGGLFHPNCRHNMSTYFPGISSLPAPVDEEEALGNYRAEQQQRYMERQTRMYKRREVGSTDPENRAAAKAKVKEWEGKLREHLAEHNQLRRERGREGYGYPNNTGNVTINTSIPSGAIKDPKRQQKHAETYYGHVRKRKDDVPKIAKRVDWKESAIQEIKNHVFIKEHLLQGKMQRFYPDYDQSQAWQRLIEGRHTEADLVFLRHEYVELTQMRIHGYSYEEAHAIANKKHNWQKLIEEG